MKIAYDPQIFGAQTYGGISRYFCEIASRIAMMPGADVSITAPMYINNYISNLPNNIISGFRAPNMDCFQRSSGKNYPQLAIRSLGMLMGDLMLRFNSPDIIHETYFSPYRLGSRNLPRVTTIHDMIHEKFPKSSSYATKISQYKACAVKRADHVICVSESTKNDVIEILGLEKSKISVIHHGFSLINQSENNANINLNTDKPYLLYVGNRSGHKNFLGLVEAYESCPNIKNNLDLICFGGGFFNDKEINFMRELGFIDGRIRHIAGNDQLLAKLYENATAFIYPSLYEGFGIPPLEAMSHNCPVICSNTSSIPEVVGDAGEYFDPHNRESMLGAIERVVESSDYRKLLISKGRKRLKNFSWDNCALRTFDIYRKLA